MSRFFTFVGDVRFDRLKKTARQTLCRTRHRQLLEHQRRRPGDRERRVGLRRARFDGRRNRRKRCILHRQGRRHRGRGRERRPPQAPPSTRRPEGESQFRLLKTDRFLPLFAPGHRAFNDNAYRAALAILITFGMAGQRHGGDPDRGGDGGVHRALFHLLGDRGGWPTPTTRRCSPGASRRSRSSSWALRC